MAETTKIEWADATVNIWQGCAKIAAGCKNCYAERDVARWGFDVWGSLKPRLYCSGWEKKLRALDRKAARLGRRLRVFINSESDFFEDHAGTVINRDGERLLGLVDTFGRLHVSTRDLPPMTLSDLREAFFYVADELRNIDLLLVTKRSNNVRRCWQAVEVHSQAQADDRNERGELFRRNVWVGVSISEPADARATLPPLYGCRDLTPVLFVSGEPILDAVEVIRPAGCHRCGCEDIVGIRVSSAVPFDYYCSADACANELPLGVDLVIVGGESGPNARPCNVAWIRSIVQKCDEAEVPCFVKQLGAHVVDRNDAGFEGDDVDAWPMDTETIDLEQGWQGQAVRVRLRDPKGGDPTEWPEDLRVRELPIVEEVRA